MSDAEVQQRIERLRSYLASDPANPHLVAELVPLALKSGQPEIAEQVVRAALQRSPGDPALRFQAGTLALARLRWDAAREAFAGLLSDGETHPAIRYNAAYAALRDGDAAAALDFVDAIPAEALSQVPELRKLQGQCLQHLERGEEAVERFQQYTAGAPGDAEGWGLLALAAADEGRDELVTAASARAFALDPDSVLANVALGAIALDVREADTALRHFSKAVEHHPVNGRAWSGLAFAQTLRLELEESERSFAKAVEYMPDHIGTWHGLAWLQILRKDLVAARHSIQKAMDIDHNFAETHGSLAVIHVLEGHEDKARFQIRRALGLNKDSASGLYAQSLLLARQGQPHASMDELLAQISTSLGMEGDDLKASSQRVLSEFALRQKKSRPKPKAPPRTLH